MERDYYLLRLYQNELDMEEYMEGKIARRDNKQREQDEAGNAVIVQLSETDSGTEPESD